MLRFSGFLVLSLIVLLSGCAAPLYQLEFKLAGVDMPWKPSGTPTREDICYRVGARLRERPYYLDGKPYTVLARCVEKR